MLYKREKNEVASSDTSTSYITRPAMAYAFVAMEDVFLRPGAIFQHQVGGYNGHSVVLIPIINEIAVLGPNQQTTCVSTSALFCTDDDNSFSIKNTNNQYDANFLLITLPIQLTAGTYSYHLKQLNVLESVLPEHEPCRVSIGVFEGRRDLVYTPRKGADVFAWVVNGVFEIEGRLLEHRDGLHLANTSSIELEALSDAAILILLDITKPIN